MEELPGKRLLILGGITSATDIVKTAQEMGVYVIVTDYLPDSPAKKVADESSMTSTTDIGAVVQLCKNKEIDGVFTGYIDSMLPYCCDVCQELDFPFYATKEQIETCIDKEKFKDACKKYDIPIIQEYNLDNNFSDEDMGQIEYPVILKPVDNSGSRGIFVCHNEKELREYYPQSLKYSPSKNIIVEQYIEDHEAMIFYMIQDGKAIFCGLCDRHIQKLEQNTPPLPIGYYFPSKLTKIYEEKMDGRVKNMLSALGFKNGIFSIQSIVKGTDFYFYEVCYRFCGTQSFRFIDNLYNINPMKLMIRHALTGEMYDTDISSIVSPYYPKHCFVQTVLLKDGTIGDIRGVEEVSQIPEVLHVSQLLQVGVTLANKAAFTQIALRIYIVADNLNKLKEVISTIQETITILDVDGQNMIIGEFDTSLLSTETCPILAGDLV